MKFTKWIAMLLCLCMIVGLLPMAALAAPALEKKHAETEKTWTVEGKFDTDVLQAAGDSVYGEAEPNDEPETSNLIEHDYTVNATLSGEDVDCYAFEVNSVSTVTVVSACTTGNLMYGLFDYESGELVVECEYLGLDEESGLYMDGFSCEVPAGVYVLLFLEMNQDYAEYAFYLEILESHYHEYDEGKVTKEPTCTENGVITYTCSCGDSYTEEIMAEGHKFSDGKCTVCGISGGEVIATGKHNGGVISWELTAEGGLILSGNGSMLNMEEYEWDLYADMITSVVIGDGITNIADGAFMEFYSLEHVDIGNSVTIIDQYAFAGDYELKNVTIPASVTEIRYGAFWMCTSMSEIAFESGSKLKVLGQAAFSESGLADVSLPESLEIIEDAAFINCYYLTEIVIPANVKSFGSRVFAYCENLKLIHFLGDAPAFSGESFQDLSCEVRYPADNDTWNEVVVNKYGGDIVWVVDHEHAYTSVVTAPTCTAQGYTTYTCECGDSYKDNYVAALGHDYETSVVTAPTCTAQGYTTYTCSVCGHSYKDNYVDMVDHEFGAYEFDKATKTHVSECAVCGEKLTESCTFDEGTVVREATMEKFGIIEFTCTVCGGSYESETVYRVFGAGRSETAIAAAEELKEVLGIEKFDAIILAGGEGFADALAGSYLAVQKDAPILLVRASTIELNKNYVLNNLAENGTVYILGGPAAVPQEMEDALSGLNVVRLQGDDRFQTNLKILEEAGIDDEEILICTGWNFADSLSASATGLPILMLNTVKDELTAEQEAFLAKYADNEFTIIGGTAAVSEKLEADVEAIVGAADRVSGNTREETSVKVAKRYFSVPDYAVVAYSRNFPDGLCGGPLAHALKSPLLLVNTKQETPAAEYIQSQGITQGFVLGGTAAVSEDSARIVFDLK